VRKISLESIAKDIKELERKNPSIVIEFKVGIRKENS